MMTVYIDDSGIGDPPVSVMAGWIAPVDVWRSFSEAWDQVLRMSPRIQYFKYDEAMGDKGEFFGISQERRDEKIRLLVDCIGNANLLGLGIVIHHAPFERLFAKSPYVDVRNHYMHCFYGAVARIMRHFDQHGIEDQIQFVFDEQLIQEPRVMEGWDDFVRNAPPEWRNRIFGRPHFLDDKKVVALQAADLHAGWLRQLEMKENAVPIWGSRADHIQRLNWVMDDDLAAELYHTVYGVRPLRITYSYGYGYPPTNG